MKTGKRGKRRQQSGSGRAVLVTLYVTKPRRNGGGGGPASAAPSSSRDVHHHHHHHHRRLHDASSNDARRGLGDGRGYDRRADLLEYSRHLRTTAAAAATPPPPPRRPKPLPLRRDIETVGAVRRHDGRQPAADDDRRLVRRRLQRAGSQRQVRQRCLAGDWSWRRVFMLVLPCNNNIESTRSRKKKGKADNDSKKNTSNKTKAWPAAVQLVGKLKVERSRRSTINGDEGLARKLFSMFRQQSRSSHR